MKITSMKSMNKRNSRNFKLSEGVLYSRQCNLCSKSFEVVSRFRRFCDTCRRESEAYRVAEWMPQYQVIF